MYSLSNVNPATVARYGVAGGAAGLSVGALTELLHQLRLSRRLRDVRAPVDTDSGTLVLDLPGDKAASNPDTYMASVLAALLSGGAGYAGARAIGRRGSDKLLEDETERARIEFLDKLSPPGASPAMKMAEAMSAVEEALCGPVDKTAQARSPFSMSDQALGTLQLLGLLAFGGSAYASKQYYDNRLKAERDAHFRPPKITRVVFRAPQPGNDVEQGKLAHDLARAAVCAHALAIVGDGLESDEQAKLAAAADDVPGAAFDYVMGAVADKSGQAPGGELLVSLLEQSPGLRGYALNKGMERMPIMRMMGRPGRWLVNNVGPVRGMAERAMYKRLRSQGLSALSPGLGSFAQTVSHGASRAYGAVTDALSSGYNRYVRPALSPEMQQRVTGYMGGSLKAGGILPTPATMLAGVLGAELAGDQQQVPPRPPVEQGEAAPPVVEAEGAAAEAYLASHRPQIERALAQLARDGAFSQG